MTRGRDLARRACLAALATVGTATGCTSAELPLASAAGSLGGDPGTACPAPYDDPGHPPRPGANEGFVAAGQSRSFELRLPPSSFAGPRPLILAFHGTGESGARFVRRARLAELTARGFLVVAPDAVGNGSLWPVWDGMHLPGAEGAPNPDLELADRLLACTAAHFAIDPRRVFAIGHSAGAIFTNHLLRSRSRAFAGGIVASGVFDFTSPPAPAPLDAMTVIVTFGGRGDGFGGGGPPPVSGFTFEEQASLASRFFASEPAVAHAQCRGDDLGHVWLPLNPWFAEILLARPKGTPAASVALPPLPAGAPVSCSLAPFVDPPFAQTTCPDAPRAGCRETCQLLTDCALENKTVGTALASELASLGLTQGACGACVDRCAAGATSPADEAVLACFRQAGSATSCGPGIEGSLPLFAAIDGCCAGATGSTLCRELCATLTPSIGGLLLRSCPAAAAP